MCAEGYCTLQFSPSFGCLVILPNTRCTRCCRKSHRWRTLWIQTPQGTKSSLHIEMHGNLSNATEHLFRNRWRCVIGITQFQTFRHGPKWNVRTPCLDGSMCNQGWSSCSGSKFLDALHRWWIRMSPMATWLEAYRATCYCSLFIDVSMFFPIDTIHTDGCLRHESHFVAWSSFSGRVLQKLASSFITSNILALDNSVVELVSLEASFVDPALLYSTRVELRSWCWQHSRCDSTNVLTVRGQVAKPCGKCHFASFAGKEDVQLAEFDAPRFCKFVNS